MQNRESPDFRSPEVGRYVVVDSVLCDFLILEQYMMIEIKIKIKKNDLPTNNALHYLDKDFGFGGNVLDESAEMKVKKN